MRCVRAAVLIDLATMTGLAILSVALWTVRVAFTAKGLRVAAAAAAAVEAIVFAAAFSRIAGHLDSPAPLAAYALGVGVGTLLGLAVHGRLTRSHVQVEVVTPEGSVDLTRALHERGWPTTATTAEGITGRVVVASVTVDDQRLDDLLDDIGRLAPEAFWTVRAVRAAQPSVLPPGLTQITGAPRHRRPPASRAPRPPAVRAASVLGEGRDRGRSLAHADRSFHRPAGARGATPASSPSSGTTAVTEAPAGHGTVAPLPWTE